MSPLRMTPSCFKKSVILAAALMSAASVVGVANAQSPAPAAPPAAAAAPTPDVAPPPPPPGAGPRGHRPPGGEMFARMAQLPPAERSALLDARLAAIKAGLELTADQQKLWGPVESAVRDSVAQMSDMRQKLQKEGRPSDPVARLQRQADLLAARAANLQKFAAAAQPLYASLDAAQKARIPRLMGMAGHVGAFGERGQGMRGDNARPGYADRGDRRGPSSSRDRMDRGRGQMEGQRDGDRRQAEHRGRGDRSNDGADRSSED